MVSVVTAPTTNRESLRASVFDVCLELGALDENSLVAEWMFNDPLSDGPNIDDDRRTIGQESISIGWEDTGISHNERRHIPFSVRASAFAARLKQKGKSRQKTNDSSINRDTSHEFGTGHVSMNRRTFFQRTTRKSDTDIHRDKIAFPSPSHTGLVSTNSKSFFRLKTRSTTGPPNIPSQPEPNLKASTLPPTFDADLQASSSGPPPPIQVTSLGEDDDWEEIEARPQSPLYALKNKGINPAPAVLAKKKRSGGHVKYNENVERSTPPRSTFLPILSQRRNTARSIALFPSLRPRHNRRKLSISTNSIQPRGFSTSLPSSPFLLVTSHDTGDDPVALSTSVVPSPLNTPPTPVFPVSISKTYRTSMGYHNQFFPNTLSKRAHPKSASYPSLPNAMASQNGRQIPFPRMPVCTLSRTHGHLLI